MEAVKLIISGKVQGVFFRKYTKEKALQLSLVGQVRNLSDGSVEIIAKGSATKISDLVDWCHVGSPMSKVINVERLPFDQEQVLGTDFRIDY